MRVLMVHNFYQQAGGEDFVFHAEADLLRERGHEVVPLTLTNEAIADRRARAAAALAATWSRDGYTRARAALAQARPDVMHVHNFFPLFSPSIFAAAADAGVATVMTLHNYRLICASAQFMRAGAVCEKCLVGSTYWGAWHRCYRGSFLGSLALARMIDTHRRRGTWDTIGRLIALTGFAKDKFVSAGVDAARITVKPNFVPDPLVAAQRDGPGDPRRRGGLFVGRLSAEKGVGFLVDAWRDIDAPLTIVGDGPEADACRDAAPPHVRFLGRRDRDEIFALMREAAFLVMPSLWYEGFPITLVEAYANGLPVLGSRLGSLIELIEEPGAGATFPAGDRAAFVELVQRALAEPALMEAWAHRARHRYEQTYTPVANGAKLERIYDEAIAASQESKPLTPPTAHAPPA